MRRQSSLKLCEKNLSSDKAGDPQLASGAFAQHAERLHDKGFRPTPVRGMKPAVNAWLKRRFAAGVFSKFAQYNVGVVTGEVIAIDIDEEDPIRAKELQTLVQEKLGSTPFIRVGRW